MKKLISIISLTLALCVTANAEFKDDTFVGVQGGVNLIGAQHMGQGVGANSIVPGFGLELYGGKWFAPWVGARVGWQGATSAYYSAKSDAVNVNFLSYLHADALLNLHGLFFGENPGRVWNCSLYGGLGWFYNDVNALGLNAGLFNQFRINDSFGITLDLRAVAANSNKILGDEYVAYADAQGCTDPLHNWGGVATGLVGVYYNFGKGGSGSSNSAVDPNVVAAALAAAAAADADLDAEYRRLLAAQDKADNSVVKTKSAIKSASEVYEKAAPLMDAEGGVTTEAYEGLPLDVAAIYAEMANNEQCPDFNEMSKKERKAWDKAHADILPDEWNSMSNDEKNQWLIDNVYTPAENAKAEKAAADKAMADAHKVRNTAVEDIDNAIVLAQAFSEKANARVDANGEVTPVIYGGEANPYAQRYADIANNETCPDFANMTRKELRDWNKAHKDILPAGWKKFTPEQKTNWLNETIFNVAAKAKDIKGKADYELERALARKVDFDKNCQFPEVKAADAKIEATGYFTINISEFNKKQLANWKKAISHLDKTADYVVTGYADKETGSAKRNAELRQERCEYVKNLMIEEGFTGNIIARPAEESEKLISTPLWRNRSAVIR